MEIGGNRWKLMEIKRTPFQGENVVVISGARRERRRRQAKIECLAMPHRRHRPVITGELLLFRCRTRWSLGVSRERRGRYERKRDEEAKEKKKIEAMTREVQ